MCGLPSLGESGVCMFLLAAVQLMAIAEFGMFLLAAVQLMAIAEFGHWVTVSSHAVWCLSICTSVLA